MPTVFAAGAEPRPPHSDPAQPFFVIIALNLIAARERLWLPSVITDKSVSRADLKRMVDRGLPYLERLEKVCKPRLPIVTEPAAKVLIGLVVLVLGFIMILPIPFLGNMPPGFAADRKSVV